ncbi:hypothetical protein [Clostridium sp. Cult1]|nr:hypothetical protein [Clostridium sp. Cult1]
MDEKRITAAVGEAARLLRENPEWTYIKATDKAKEELSNEGMEKVEKTN